MKRYAAFLRGVNISGRNKVPMAALKAGFEELGFAQVKTCLNSGNVVFSAEQKGEADFPARLETMLKSKFDLEIPVFVMEMQELQDLLRHAPPWWGTEDRQLYHNLIFIMPPMTFGELFREIGEPKQELERIEPHQKAVFWSFSRKDYQKTNWWSKTASAKSGRLLTIRTANTVRKLAGL